MKTRFFLILTFLSFALISCNSSGSKVSGRWMDWHETIEYLFNSDGTYTETDLLVTHNHEITGQGTYIINSDNSITLNGTHKFYQFKYEDGTIYAYSVSGITDLHKK